jgi:putative tricarboxylic transport membrane protein
MNSGIHPKDRLDAAVAGIIALFGIYFIWASNKLPAGPEPAVPGPAAAPGFLGALLLGCGVVLIIRAVINHGKDAAQTADPIETDVVNSSAGLKPLLAIGLLIASALLLEPLGFMLSTFLFLFAGFVWLGDANWRIALPTAAAASASLWLFFTKLLGVGLPYGLIVEVLFR